MKGINLAYNKDILRRVKASLYNINYIKLSSQ